MSEDVKFSNVRGLYLRKCGTLNWIKLNPIGSLKCVNLPMYYADNFQTAPKIFFIFLPLNISAVGSAVVYSFNNGEWFLPLEYQVESRNCFLERKCKYDVIIHEWEKKSCSWLSSKERTLTLKNSGNPSVRRSSAIFDRVKFSTSKFHNFSLQTVI